MSNRGNVSLVCNGQTVKGKKADKHTFVFKIKLKDKNVIRAQSGEIYDECVINRVNKPDYNYKMHVKSETQSWQK